MIATNTHTFNALRDELLKGHDAGPLEVNNPALSGARISHKCHGCFASMAIGTDGSRNFHLVRVEDAKVAEGWLKAYWNEQFGK